MKHVSPDLRAHALRYLEHADELAELLASVRIIVSNTRLPWGCANVTTCCTCGGEWRDECARAVQAAFDLSITDAAKLCELAGWPS